MSGLFPETEDHRFFAAQRFTLRNASRRAEALRHVDTDSAWTGHVEPISRVCGEIGFRWLMGDV
jgi:hypothetical protein